MRIVIFRTFGTELDINSYNCQEIGLAKALIAKGHSVSVIMAGAKSEQIQMLTAAGAIDIYKLPYIGTKGFSLFRGWKALLGQLNPQVIQIHDVENIMSNRVARYAAKHDIPCVMVCGVHKSANRAIVRFAKRLFNIFIDIPTLKHIKYIGAKTPDAGEYANTIHQTPYMVTPIGLDEERFNADIQVDWYERLSIDKESKILVYVGRLDNNGRNPLFLLDVLKQLPKQYHLIYVGSGELTYAIKSRAAELGLQMRTHLAGKIAQEQLPSLYRICEFALMPSTYEIYGMVTIEAMYFGLPVISSASAGAKAIITSAHNGYIIEEFDCEKWAKTINDCTGERRVQMGNNATRHIKENLTWSAAVDRFIELYNRALK